MKHLTKTLAVVSLLLPMSAQPLGIGDLKLHSALNQKLNAEIHLHLAAGENPADVSVRLAPPEKFDQAGVPWNYFLSKIKFNPVVLPNGSIVVKVTSREPLTEPFLDFLLEVVWPQGSQFREFTVLVDPPAAYNAPTSPSAANIDYRVEPLNDYERPVRNARVSRKRVSRADVASHISPQTPTSGEYGPIEKSQTLWGIADRLGGERNVPTQQMMYALYKANPDAFINGNMDALKAGAVLKIPETDAILQGSGKSGDKPVRKPATKPSPADNKALELVAPADAKVSDATGDAGSGQPGQDGIGTAAGTGSSDAKDIELQTRIDRLEQQLNMMQQLLALKDQQLAALQSNDQQAAEQAAESAQSLPSTPSPQTEAETRDEITPAQPTIPVEQPPAAVQPQATTDVKPVPAAPKPKPVVPTPPAVVEEPDFFSSSTYYLTVGGISAGIIGLLGWLLWRKRKIESQTNTESMFASASQIRMPDSDSALSVPVMDINSTGAYDVGTVGESSFISDFTPSDFEAFDTDQTDIDPMSEADVYLAYGRYQQAEELIRQAITDQPDKDDYKLKLLEIFYANENKDAFAAYAQELVDVGKNADRSFWSKVADMAKEIIPDSALFGGVAKAAANTGLDATEQSPTQKPAAFDMEDDSDSAAGGSDDDLIDLEAATLPDMALMDEVNSELAEMQLTLADESDDNSLDFDLGSLSTPTESKDEPEDVAAVVPDIESIDFDLSDISAGDNADTEAEKTESAEPLESFDFNFDLDEKTQASEKEAADKAASEESLDMESLESFEFPEFSEMDLEEKPKPEASPVSLDDSASASDEFDFNFDFDAPVSGSDSEVSDEDIDFGVSDLTDMDEFETKIDLAKAYIDMGDADAAKVIAEEVLAKGNAEQKQAAQALLDELT